VPAKLADITTYIREHNPGTIVGVDEAGRGSWAGPIVAAAAAVSVNWVPELGVTDSKKLNPKKRNAIVQRYEHDDTVVVGIGVVGHEDIDREGIDWAQAEAQALAIRATFWRLAYPPFVVVDGLSAPNIEPPEVAKLLMLPKADDLVPAVSLASVFAKVTRDRILAGYEVDYPGYGWTDHCGYGTAKHQEALIRLGPCSAHRKSFGPVRKALDMQAAPKPLLSLAEMLEMLDTED